MTEQQRLEAHYQGKEKWLTWGPYLSERQWGTVREDYSADGNAWNYFPHDHARSRVYRWGEDGLAGISDDQQRMCFALALWNGKDSILKERLFGLSGPEGNHAEDVKELYYYLDNTPSHAYMKYLYKYSHHAYPYGEIVHTNHKRNKHEPEFELLDTGIFDQGHYFDVWVTYAKSSWDDIAIEIEVVNRGEEEADIWVIPTLWYRNLWEFGRMAQKPSLTASKQSKQGFEVHGRHPEIGEHYFWGEKPDYLLFTENETNQEKVFGRKNPHPFVKDAFHRAVVEDDYDFLKGRKSGTKCGAVYHVLLEGGESRTFKFRLSGQPVTTSPLKIAPILSLRKKEADAFYESMVPSYGDRELANIQRQAFAGLLWNKQYYNLDIPSWLDGDPGQPPPPDIRKQGRNTHWRYLNNEDIISMPDKWEYPWYAAWDLAFHCVPLAMIDPAFAKNQLILMMREWYMHPNGQIPAYEWNFSDVNPPVQAWAALKVYEIDKQKTGKGDIHFLKRIFQKLMLNFTWWVNRKDSNGNNVFEGGFLGLDNIGVFDRSAELPGGGHLEQADGTSWMATYSLNMMQMALEIAVHDDTFEDVATKFFEHFIYIAETLNHMGPDGLWDEEDGFYYDQLHLPDGQRVSVKVRSLVGLTPLFAVCVIPQAVQEKVPEFMERLRWFLDYRQNTGVENLLHHKENGDLLMGMVPQHRLSQLLKAMLDEHEFLSIGGIRSISKFHAQHYYELEIAGEKYGLRYEPGESSTYLFGGNSNWRGPVWFPMNYMLIQALYLYCDFFDGESGAYLPTGSPYWLNLTQVADEISRRLIHLFMPDHTGQRPAHGDDTIYARDPYFKDLILYYEYFHGDTGRGIGASHQTGWTGLVAELIDRAGWKTMVKIPDRK
ncbi:MAG: glucosidase [Bacteroidota bacterium]